MFTDRTNQLCKIIFCLPHIILTIVAVLSSLITVRAQGMTFAGIGPANNLSLALTKGRWSILSQEVNQFTAITAGQSGETWLGTMIGVKRVTVRGTRFYTSLDGLPSGPVVAITSRGGLGKEIWCAIVSGRLRQRENLSTLSPPVVIICRFDVTKDRWIPLSPLHLSDVVHLEDILESRMEGTISVPRILLAVSGTGEVFVALGDINGYWRDTAMFAGKNPVGPALFRFESSKHSWKALPAPENTVHPLIAFLQPATGSGIFMGTVNGLFQWEQKTGWNPILRGEVVRAGVRQPGGDWWLTTWSFQSRREKTPELLHLDASGKVIHRNPFPAIPQPENVTPRFGSDNPPQSAPPTLGYDALQDLVLTVTDGPHPEIRAVFASMARAMDCTPMNVYPIWMVRFDANSGKSLSEVQMVQNNTSLLATVPEKALIPLLMHSALGSAISSGIRRDTNITDAVSERFPSYYNKSSSVMPAYSDMYPNTYSASEAGIDADGATWNRSQNDKDKIHSLVRTDSKGNKEHFFLPPISILAFADLAGVAVTDSGTLLTLTQDSFLRHTVGADSWQVVDVPDYSGLWLRYGYASRLVAHSDDAWLATDGFAMHYNAGHPETASPLFRPTSGSAIRLLGIRSDGASWISTHESGVMQIDPSGKAVRSNITPPSPATSLPVTPLSETGGVLGDTLWYLGFGKLPDGNSGTSLLGYDTRAERWTAPLVCYKVIALRSGVDEAIKKDSVLSDTVWALVEEQGTAATKVQLYRWWPDRDKWEAVGPSLPKEARLATTCLRIVHARPDDLWIVDRDRIALYYWDGSAAEWTVHHAPAGAGIEAGNSIAAAGVYTPRTIEGTNTPTIYIAGITGLWEYQIIKKSWCHIGLPTVGQWWIFRVADG